MRFDNLPAGEYAVSIAHDENSNGKVDFSWLHIPNEGYGVSNNAKGFMSPPSYSDAKFELNKSQRVDIKINVLY